MAPEEDTRPETGALLQRLRALKSVRASEPPWDASALHEMDRDVLDGPTPAARAAALEAREHALHQQLDAAKQAFTEQMRAAYEASIQPLLQGHGGEGTELNEHHQVLNEDGLPFVDPLEALPDSPPLTPHWDTDTDMPPTSNVLNRTPGQVARFDPTLQGTERKQWMDKVLQQLEDEEAAEAPAEPPAAPTPSGLRRGFLQQRASERAERPPEDDNDNDNDNDDAPKAPPPKPKRHVRIVEPHDDDDDDDDQEAPAPRKPARRAVPLGMDPEDAGVQEEAARIVELLGPEVIAGHPNAERIFAEMRESQPQMVVAPPAEEAAAPPSGPAVRDTVQERDADAPTPAASAAPKRKLSAFKQRQLAKQTASDVPEAPRISQGISAIERAGRADDEREAAQGAAHPPPVPHARPTKAYAEKLAKRRAEAAEAAVRETSPPASDARSSRRVRFGGEEVRHMSDDDEMSHARAWDDDDDAAEEEEDDDDDEMDHVPAFDDDDDDNDNDPMPVDSDDDSLAWDSDDDVLWDSDDEYRPEDLEALRPAMDGHPDDQYWSEDLAREYAEAKARLALPTATPALREPDDNQDMYGVRTHAVANAHTDCAARCFRQRPDGRGARGARAVARLALQSRPAARRESPGSQRRPRP